MDFHYGNRRKFSREFGGPRPAGGGYCPVSPRSEELAPESSNGQTTSRVSTAGIRVGLATAEEGSPPLDRINVWFPALEEAHEDAWARLRGDP